MSQVDPILERTLSTAAYESIEVLSLVVMVWRRRKFHICLSNWTWHSGSLYLKVLLVMRRAAQSQKGSLEDVTACSLLLLQNLFSQPIHVSVDIRNWNVIVSVTKTVHKPYYKIFWSKNIFQVIHMQAVSEFSKWVTDIKRETT